MPFIHHMALFPECSHGNNNVVIEYLRLISQVTSFYYISNSYWECQF